MKIKIIIFTAVLLLTILSTLAGVSKKWDGKQLLKWQRINQTSGAKANLTATGSNLNAVMPNDPGFKRCILNKVVPLGKDKPKVLKIILKLAEPVPVAPISAIIIFSGGKSPGNGSWNKIVQGGITTGGKDYVGYVIVPKDAKKLTVKLLFPENSGTTKIASLALQAVTPEMLKAKTVKLSVKPERIQAAPSDFLAGCQMVGILPGLYYGTLPPGQTGSKRREFIQFLAQCGIKATRYPGGTISHFFLPEGAQYTREILKKCSPKKLIWPRGHLTSWPNFKDTMKTAGIKIIYQLNTSFYLDNNGKIGSICPSKFTRKANLDDGKEHFTAAAAALERCFKQGLFKPGDVDYWEMGNEEFAYMSMKQYADIVAAFVKVLHQYDPGRPVCVSHTRFKGLEVLLKQRGVLKHITGLTSHYPYAHWPRPSPANATAGYRNFAYVWVDFPKAVSKVKTPQKISVSETNIYKFFTYDSFRIGPSYAFALAFARNWPYLMASPNVDMAVLHDFESTYFGLVKYNVEFSNVYRRFEWLEKHFSMPSKKKGSKNWYVNPNPNNSKEFFPGKYVISPAARVFKMLSEFCGGKIFSAQLIGKPNLQGVLAGISPDGGKLVFACNPYQFPLLLEIAYPEFSDKCTTMQIDSDNYSAVLDTEYRFMQAETVLKKINGNPIVILPPRSVILLKSK